MADNLTEKALRIYLEHCASLRGQYLLEAIQSFATVCNRETRWAKSRRVMTEKKVR